MPEESKIIELLAENNRLLKELLEMKKKQQRSEAIGKALHLAATLLPFIVILILGWFAWQWINHYLEIMNSNINALKSNFDILRDFLQKLMPDFSGVAEKLQETWQDVQFWK